MSRLQKPGQPASGAAGQSKPSSLPSQLAASLRTRRPSAAPKASKAPQFGAPLARPGGDDTRRARAVSDKIKSRLSVRYADGPSLPTHPAPPVPSLPSHPGALGARRPTLVDDSMVDGGPGAWVVPEELGGSDDEDAGMAGRGVGTGDMGLRRDPGQVDLSEIGKDGFDPEACTSPAAAPPTWRSPLPSLAVACSLSARGT